MQKYGSKATIVVTVLIAVVAAAVIYGGFRYNKAIGDRLARLTEKTETESGPESGFYTAKIYFADEQYEKLVAEMRELEKEEEPEDGVKRVINELIKGPDSDELARTLPEDAKLKSVFVSNGVAMLDFDEGLVSEKYGTTGELFLINSVYKTVTENVADVNSVQILVDGSKGPTLYGKEGHLYSGIPRVQIMGKKVER